MAGNQWREDLKNETQQAIGVAKAAKALAEQLANMGAPHTALQAVKKEVSQELAEEIVFLLKTNGHEIHDPEISGIAEIIRRKLDRPL